VPGGLQTTFDVLAATRNEAAVSVLLPALDSEQRAVQEGALRALLARRSAAGHRELVHRWDALGERARSIVVERAERLSGAVRDALLASDPRLCANACEVLLRIHDYDLVPVLVGVAEDEANPNRDVAAQTLVRLAEALYVELAAPRDYQNRRNPQLIRQHVVTSLEASMQRFDRHKCREVLDAFLILSGRENVTLKRLLQNPHEPAYLAAIEALNNSPRPGVMRLILSFLDDPHAPLAIINVLTHRGDRAFVRHLLNKIGHELTSTMRANIRRMESLSWLHGDLTLLDALDDNQQSALVQLSVGSGMKRVQAFGLVQLILRTGRVGGRRAASLALSGFTGSHANQLVIEGLEDDDPQVVANLLEQLRKRGIPGALTRLMEFVDSPHPEICRAVQRSLGEFSFSRFLAAFDMLDEKVRGSTGWLVRRIDPTTVSGLAAELAAEGRSRRLRALAVAPYACVVDDLCGQIVELLSDADHFVRAAAAQALGHSSSADAQQALRMALLDRSVTVQEAAEASLQAIAERGAAAAARDGQSPDLKQIADGLGSMPETDAPGDAPRSADREGVS